MLLGLYYINQIAEKMQSLPVYFAMQQTVKNRLRAYPNNPSSLCHSEAKPKNLANEEEIPALADLRLHFATPSVSLRAKGYFRSE